MLKIKVEGYKEAKAMLQSAAFITSFSLGAPAGDNATYSYSLTGSGNLAPTPKTPQA